MKSKILEIASKAEPVSSPENEPPEAAEGEDEGKQAFLDMCKAIKSGDFEAAYTAFKDAMELC
jgi:hypothetical protein